MRELGRHRPAHRCRACAAFRTTSAACSRRRIRSPIDEALAAAGAGGLSTRVRVVPRARRRTHRHGDPAWTKSAPIAIGWTCGRTASATAYNAYGDRPRLEVLAFPHAPTATCRAARWPVAARRRTCTTDRCRRWPTCSSRRQRGRSVLARLRRLRSGRASASSSSGPEAAARRARCYDTSQPGNSNAGHTYGTTLPADSKRALIEYSKTL